MRVERELSQVEEEVSRSVRGEVGVLWLNRIDAGAEVRAEYLLSIGAEAVFVPRLSLHLCQEAARPKVLAGGDNPIRGP